MIVPPSVGSFLLLDCRDKIEQLLSFTRESSVDDALRSIAASIACNPRWRNLRVAHLAARTEPEPLLAAFGAFDAEQTRHLEELSAHLNEVMVRRRFVDYSEAETITERLAGRLVDRFGRQALESFRFTAIPRGGLFVLGMLSYLLRLSPNQVVGLAEKSPDVGDDALVIVDDCSLSGTRFKQVLNTITAPRIVFCPLYANAELCRRIERCEGRVVACICAEELEDVAPERFGEHYEEWRDQRQQALGDSGFWVGIPEYIGFSWSEPQTRSWNAETGRFDEGWNVLPPTLCLKRRVSAKGFRDECGTPAAASDYTLCASAEGPIQPAARVVWATIDDSDDLVVAVARMPDETFTDTSCYRLEGTAAEMWSALMEHGSISGVLTDLSVTYGVDARTLRTDVHRFVDDLEGHGLLTCDWESFDPALSRS